MNHSKRISLSIGLLAGLLVLLLAVAVWPSKASIGSRITVIKEATPEDDTGFNFDLTNNADVDEEFTLMVPSNPSIQVSGLLTGTYSLGESVPPGWDLTNINCQSATGYSSYQVSNPAVTIFLSGDNDDVTCSFTNVKQGSITIIKDAWPEDDTPFPFTEDISDPASTFTLKDPSDDTKQFDDVPPGSYTIKELIPDGWILEQNGCEETVTDNSQGSEDGTVNIELEPGESVTCTYVNIGPPAAKLTILKSADPRDGTDFPFTIDGQSPFRILYREIFPLGDYTGVTEGARQNALDEGWRGYWDGKTVDTDPITDNTGMQIFGPGTPNFQVAINSNPVNSGDGMGFWSPSESRVILYTEEFSFARSRLEQIRYETRHNDADQPQQDFPLLKIDGKWYSPDCQYVNTDVAGYSDWIPAQWQVTNITWMELDIDPATNRAKVPGQDCVVDNVSFFAPLQTGLAFSSLGTTVEAFGLYLPETFTNAIPSVRFDNYTLVGRNDLVGFTLDDADPDDGDVYLSGISLFVAPGVLTVTEQVPVGWDLTNINCDGGTPQESGDGVTVTLAERDEVTCTFSNELAGPPNVCPAESPYVGNETTRILGLGLYPYQSTIAVIKDPQQVTGLYAQLAGKKLPKSTYTMARFIPRQGATNLGTVDDGVVDSAEFRDYAVFWYGESLDGYVNPQDPSQNPDRVLGRLFVTPGSATNMGRALILYPDYATRGEFFNYASVREADPAAQLAISNQNHVYWYEPANWYQTQTYEVDLGGPLAEGRPLQVQTAVVDNDPDKRPVWLTIRVVDAGGAVLVEKVFKPTGPTNGKMLNINRPVFDAPAGAAKVVITLSSPYRTGDSAALVGVVANYPCGAPVR